MRPSALPRANILAPLPTMAIAGAPVVALSFASGGGYPTAWNLLTISMVVAGTVVSKRIIIGCRQKSASEPILPVNLDTWVQKF